MPRDATFWVDTDTGLRPVVRVAATRMRNGESGPERSTTGAYGLVLQLAGVTSTVDLVPAGSPAEDRYREVLQAIARGREDSGRPIRAEAALDLARRALIEMGDDWTKRGTAGG